MNKIHFREINSTNTYAKDKLGTEGFKHATLITADRQTSGRGRHGNSFYSEGGLYMTVMLDSRFSHYHFTMACAVAVRESLRELSGINTKIKWVNDLFYSNKKVCGILVETKLDENSNAMGFVCGIGINTSKAVIPENLSQIAGTVPYEKDNLLLAELIAEKLIFMYENNINPLEKYKEGLILNVPVNVYSNGKFIFEGTAFDINENGNLMVKDNSCNVKILNSGEISIKL